MKNFLLLALLAIAGSLSAQTTLPTNGAAPQAKPAYCDEGLNTYGTVPNVVTGAPTALPVFQTQATKEYKIQVAILRYTDPVEYPFHPALVARYRPCEEVWVVESRESFLDRADAVDLQQELKEAGYTSAFITELVGYQAVYPVEGAR